MARYCEWFLKRAFNNDRSAGTHLVLAGNAGVGKTHSLKAVWREIGTTGVDASFTDGWAGEFPFRLLLNWPEVAEVSTPEKFDEAIYELETARVVFIDDVGAESERFKNGESTSRLKRILERCQKKWLLITTNFSKPKFHDAYDARIVDRLSRAHWCDLTGVPSYRPKLKSAKFTL